MDKTQTAPVMIHEPSEDCDSNVKQRRSETTTQQDENQNEIPSTKTESDQKLSLWGTLKKFHRMGVVWRNVGGLLMLHIGAIIGMVMYGCYAQFYTLIFINFIKIFYGMGVTAGAHRLWCHRSYEANVPLRILLMIMNCGSMQNDIIEWCRDHRVHHKFSDTDADPHNSNRGMFFSHVGWLMIKKHPDVLRKGKTISMTDLEQDPVLQFQRAFYIPLTVFFAFIVPTFVPVLLWNENLIIAFFLNLFRLTLVLNITWLVNSAAHKYGMRPYDKSIVPVESGMVTTLTFGEGYHNFHHTFPSDYSASEHGWKYNFNFSTFFIDCFAKIGWATNLKKVDREFVLKRMHRTGQVQSDQDMVEPKEQGLARAPVMTILHSLITIPVAMILVRKVFIWLRNSVLAFWC